MGVSMETTDWEATPCWIVSFSVASLADMLPSTCWVQTGGTHRLQFFREQPEMGKRLSPGLQSAFSGANPSRGHCSRSLGALVAHVSPPEPLGFCMWPQELQ